MDWRRYIDLINTITRWILILETVLYACALLYYPYLRTRTGTIEMLYALAVQSAASLLRGYHIPNQQVALYTSNCLVILGHAMSLKGCRMVHREQGGGSLMPFDKLRETAWNGLVCELETRDHYDSVGGEDLVTREIWATGRWCRGADQRTAFMLRGVDAYQRSIERERCYTVCMQPVARGNKTMHAFVSSAPAGQVPSLQFCGLSDCLGRCDEDDACSAAFRALHAVGDEDAMT